MIVGKLGIVCQFGPSLYVQKNAHIYIYIHIRMLNAQARSI
jgi:(2Fe-2S) ferredoxin